MRLGHAGENVVWNIMINKIIYAAILSSAHANGARLDDIPLYCFEKEGEIGFLLGTIHTVDLSFFPEHALQTIASCDNVFVETVNDDSTVKTNMAKQVTAWFYNSEELPLPDILSATELQAVRDALYQYITMFLDVKGIPFDLMSLHQRIIYKCLHYLVASTYSCFREHRPKLESMDQQLQELFNTQASSLEPHYRYYIDDNNEPLDEAEKEILRNKLIPFIQEGFFINMPSEELEQKLDSVKEYVGCCSLEQMLRLYSSSMDYSFAFNEDLEVTNGNLSKSCRNIFMVREIEKTIRSYKRPLYAIGAAHLFGSLGVINLLERRGYTICKVTKEGSQPLCHQYKLYIQTYKRIKEDILHPCKHERRLIF